MGRIRTSEGQINPSGNTMRWRERKNDPSNIPTNGLKLYVIKDDNEVDFRIAYELNDKSGYRIKSLVDAYVTQDEEDETVYPVFHNTPSDSHGFNNDGIRKLKSHTGLTYNSSESKLTVANLTVLGDDIN